jgi:hypothetical protein
MNKFFPESIKMFPLPTTITQYSISSPEVHDDADQLRLSDVVLSWT